MCPFYTQEAVVNGGELLRAVNVGTTLHIKQVSSKIPLSCEEDF